MRFKSIFFLIFFIIYPLEVFSHEGHSYSPGNNQDRTMDFYRKVLRLTPEITDSSRQPHHYPHIKLNGKTVYLNDPFFELVREALDLFHREQPELLGHIDPEKLVQEVRATVAEGPFYSKIWKPFARVNRRSFEHILDTSADLGARYGVIAAVLNLIFETIESKTLGQVMPGLHVICPLNYALTVATVRPAQIFGGLFRDGKTLNRSRLVLLLQRAWTGRAVRKARRKVQLRITSATIDHEQLTLVNEEGFKDRRKRYVEELSRKTAPWFKEIESLDSQIAELPPGKKRDQALRRKQKLEEKIHSAAKLHEKIYRGARYGPALGVISRKLRGGYLKGQDFPDTALALPWLWTIPAQRILDSSLVSQATETRPAELVWDLPETDQEFPDEMIGLPYSWSIPSQETLDSSLVSEITEKAPAEIAWDLPEHKIRTGLAKEFSERWREQGLVGENDASPDFIERILHHHIGRVFDPTLPKKERYAQVAQIRVILDGFFLGFVDRVFERLLDSSKEKIRWFKRFRLRWKLTSFFKETDKYERFLRSIAVTTDPEILAFHKNESMEFFLRLWEYLLQTDRITYNDHRIEDVITTLNNNLHPLKTFRPWRKKQTTWLRFPKCRKLIRQKKQ